jgi:hypothetical protein
MEDEDVIGDEDEIMRAIAVKEKRIKKNQKKEKVRQHQIEIDQIIAKHNIRDRKKNKGGISLAENIIALELGAGGCIACRCNPCLWRPCIDVDACLQRRYIYVYINVLYAFCMYIHEHVNKYISV